MWGAIIGDIVGSRFEFNNHKSKEFELFTPRNYFTDDSLMTIAVAWALKKSKGMDDKAVRKAAIDCMQELGRRYPGCGFGGMFYDWVMLDARPYNSYGNGSAMRVSPVGWVAESEEEVKRLSYDVTAISHDHPEGIKGAEAVAMAIFLARKGMSKDKIKERIVRDYYPEVEDMYTDSIRPYYAFDETCPGSVPQSFACFFEGKDFEDTLRTAVSIGGDTDTVAAIAGSMAEAVYGIPEEFKLRATAYLPDDLLEIINSL